MNNTREVSHIVYDRQNWNVLLNIIYILLMMPFIHLILITGMIVFIPLLIAIGIFAITPYLIIIVAIMIEFLILCLPLIGIFAILMLFMG